MATGKKASIHVDCSKQQGELKRIWKGLGFDEINLAYTPRGKAVFQLIKEIHETPYYIRNHNAFTSGNCGYAPAWGSTNAYNELEDGTVVYDWSVLDQVYDTYVGAGCKPLIELGFMPYDLTSGSYDQSQWLGNLGQEMYDQVGLWKYPPKDYTRWADLVYNFISHLVERYGAEEVSTWRFELWNEPDIPNYWKGTLEEYCKLYDYSVDAAVRALPTVAIGGPGSTCPDREKAGAFLDGFLKHVSSGQNYVTGQTGTRIDFLSFHTKGAFYSPRRMFNLHRSIPKDSPSSLMMMRDIKAGMEIIAAYPSLRSLPVYVDECDAAVGTPYGVYDNPNYIFHNTENYPNFVCALVKRVLDLNKQYGDTIDFITAWAFYYEGKRYFEGNRTLVDNQNIEKPLLNAFRLLGKLSGTRVSAQSDGARDVLQQDAPEVEVDALAAVDTARVTVAAWHQADPWWAEAPDAQVSLCVDKIPFTGKARVTHYRIDKEHSNSYAEWVRQGKPQDPSPAQLESIKSRMGLEPLGPAQDVEIPASGMLELEFALPLFGTSLIEIVPA